MAKDKHWNVCKASLICAGLGLLVYVNSLDCGLCFDDKAALEDNADLRHNVSWRNLLRNDFWGIPIHDKDSHKSYRPLCVASFRLNYMVHGLEPMGYHLVNVVLHAVVCYLYVHMCALVFAQVWPALLAGLLFAVHPIHTEAVSGLVGRADVLAGLLLLCAVLTYRKVFEVKWRWSWLVVAILCCLGSALSKEIGVTSAMLCLLYDYAVHNKMALLYPFKLKRSTSLPTWFSAWVFRMFIMTFFTLIFLIFRVLLNHGSPNFSVHNHPAMGFPTPYRQLHRAYLVFFNLQLLFSPSPLSAEYAMNTIPPISSLLDYRNGLTLLTFAALALLTLVSLVTRDWKWRCTFITSLGLMVFPFLPASNLFFPVGFVVAERVLYLPSMGFCMLVALGAWRLHHSHPTFVKVGILYLLLIHSTKTVVRNRDWYSSLSLFQSAVSVYPTNAKMWTNFASQLEQDGNQTLAIHMLKKAILVEPHFITAHINMAYNLRGLGDMGGALQKYQEAADLVTRGLAGEDIFVSPQSMRAYNSLSNMLREQARDGEGALKYAQKTVQLEPDWENGHHTLANALVLLGRLDQAKAAFEKALHINPQFAVAHSNYGDCLEKMGLLEEAEQSYRQALELLDSSVLTKFRLAALVIKLDKPSLQVLLHAEQLLMDVLEVEPYNGNATLNLAVIYMNLQRNNEAENCLKRVLVISPGNKEALYTLGILLEREHRYEEATVYLIQLLAEHPNHVKGLVQLGTCYMQANMTAQASEAFDLVLTLDPNNTRALQNYGILNVLKDPAKALKLMSRLLVLQPDNSPVQQQIQKLKNYLHKDSL